MTQKVFISYSHDSPEHKGWVKSFAARLLRSGIDVILDQWDLRLGEDIPQFVERSISSSDRVLLICTEQYVEKANSRIGGVGLEALVINSSLMEDLGTTKFIALVMQGSPPAIPNLLKSRLYIDFRDKTNFKSEFSKLIDEIRGNAKLSKPAVNTGSHQNAQNFTFASHEASLDLARAYIDMEDIETARDILMEVLAEGDLIQQREARELMLKVNIDAQDR